MGDIVLNLNRVALQAEEYGHSRKREFAFLIAHSMLHLCGYDHMTEADAEVMFGRQEAVLEALGITRQYELRNSGFITDPCEMKERMMFRGREESGEKI